MNLLSSLGSGFGRPRHSHQKEKKSQMTLNPANGVSLPAYTPTREGDTALKGLLPTQLLLCSSYKERKQLPLLNFPSKMPEQQSSSSSKGKEELGKTALWRRHRTEKNSKEDAFASQHVEQHSLFPTQYPRYVLKHHNC